MRVVIYESESGDCPFRLWLDSVGDSLILQRIRMRILRIEEGNLGDHKYLGEDVYELRMTFGGGIRIYFGIYNNKVVLLLTGGNKNSQQRDIKKARSLWQNFLEKNR